MKAIAKSAASVVIRSPSIRDFPAVAVLLEQLGYRTSAAAVARRLDKLGGQPNVAVFVADRNAMAIGIATGHVLSVIHADDPIAILTALVVADGLRGQGVGRGLVNAVEAWTMRCGAHRITVASGLARDGAHSFYERLGYQHTARRYSKLLGPACDVTTVG